MDRNGLFDHAGMTPSALGRRLALIAGMAILALLAACTGSVDPSPTPSGEATPSEAAATASDPEEGADPSDADAGEPLTGTLGFSDIEGGCAFLRTEDATHWEVLYPRGWAVSRDPVALVSPDGEVVAEEGDEVTVRGREARGTVSICQIGPIFEATEVVTP